ncbi:MAG: hypothetical protein JWP78_1857 [Mucilaginibacter sp.]|nr:hypothetical protein [Mucilaginibacter sp.]
MLKKKLKYEKDGGLHGCFKANSGKIARQECSIFEIWSIA